MARSAVVPAVAAALLAACGGSGGTATPDTTPPAITILGPLADETYATPTVLLRALVSDAGGLAAVEYSMDGGARSPLPAASDGYEQGVPLPLHDGVTHVLSVQARDHAGNVAEATRTFRVDRVAPAVTVTGVDAACLDACAGTVLSAAAGALHLTGTATDGSGLASGVLVLVTDEGGAEVASASVPVDSGGGFEWDWDPWAAGSFFTITVRADDPQGNAGTAARVAYVDRVIPTIASGPSPSGAPRSGPLVVFSEAMATASVEAVTTISAGSPTGSSLVDAAFAWSGARAFGFAPQLAPFTEHRLSISAGATDRAGNPLSPAGFVFETEMIPPPADPSVVATGARGPRLGVFPDGRPVVVYGTGARPRWVRWDGRGAWLDEVVPQDALAGGVAADLDTSLGARRVSALFSVPGGGAADLYFSQGDEPAWAGFPPDLVASTTLPGWSPALGVECLVPLDCHLTALFGDAVGAKYAVRTPAGWSRPNLVRAGAAARGAGNAFLDDRVYYLDTRLGPPRSPPFHEAVTNAITGVGRLVGAEGWRVLDPFYMARPVVLYTTARAGSPAAEDLTFACDSATPWRSAVTPLPTTADALALAVSSSTAAVAVALADGSVLFGTAPNGEDLCLADPQAPAWDPRGAVSDAKEPAVALGPDGATAWRAWVRTSTGELVVGR